jgi:hypothetical protein
VNLWKSLIEGFNSYWSWGINQSRSVYPLLDQRSIEPRILMWKASWMTGYEISFERSFERIGGCSRSPGRRKEIRESCGSLIYTMSLSWLLERRRRCFANTNRTRADHLRMCFRNLLFSAGKGDRRRRWRRRFRWTWGYGFFLNRHYTCQRSLRRKENRSKKTIWDRNENYQKSIAYRLNPGSLWWLPFLQDKHSRERSILSRRFSLMSSLKRPSQLVLEKRKRLEATFLPLRRVTLRFSSRAVYPGV